MPLTVAAACARRKSLKELLNETLDSVRAGLHGRTPELGLVFFSNHFEDEGIIIGREVREGLGLTHLIGGSAEGVIGPDQEIEGEPALAVWAAALPAGTQVQSFEFGQAELEGAETAEEWQQLLGGVEPQDAPSFIAIADPYSIAIGALLDAVNQHYPGSLLMGGMASGAEAAGQAALLIDDDVRRDGVVGLALTGPVRFDALVSQGCRPIGKPYVITKADRNIIYSLGGRKPLDVLREIFESGSPEEQRLMQRGIFLGRVVKEELPEFKRGDFLIRNLMDKDDRSGAIAVNDLLRTGSTVQFHVRDAATADEDLHALCGQKPAPAGALLFACNGRGTNLFMTKDHDVGVLREIWGSVPAAGFFAAGEFGPIGGRNFIHGFTASIALLREADAAASD